MKKSEITGTDYSKLRLDPIPDLKVGDLLVRVKDGVTSAPSVGDVVKIASLFPHTDDSSAGEPFHRFDFTCIINHDGRIIEIDGDSRYFERVKE